MRPHPIHGEVRTFGERLTDLEYITRPGAYGLILDEHGRVLCVEEGSGIFLPGGGIEGDESPMEALRRELVEETGHCVSAAEPLDAVCEYFVSQSGTAYAKYCHLYRVELGDRVADADLPLMRLAPAEAARRLYHEGFRWAVEAYVSRG